jgi:NTP pyrophosphatase (non-canonical NTP hydrolase)
MDSTTVSEIRKLQNEIHQRNHKWWHKENGDKLERNKGELLMLMVSEIAEGMEGERKDLMDDHLPNRKMIEVELADAVIRILDYAAGFGYDVAEAMQEKLEYNSKREDHRYEARNSANGKKW